MFELAIPWVLIFLPLPLLLWFFLPHAKVYLPAALQVPFFNELRTTLDEKRNSLISTFPNVVLYTIWCLLLLSLAGPRWVGEPQSLTREGRNIMLVLDLSGSMELPDMILHHHPVSRLAVVKNAAKQFVKQRVADRVGLILFGTRAYLQTPLTYDRHSVLSRLNDATVGLAGQTTSIGDALGLAVKRLQTVPTKGRVIILLTDGANNSGILPPLKAAELANHDKIKVYTIGLGSEGNQRALNSIFYGLNFSSDLDEKTLQAIAKLTKGQYFRATDAHSLNKIYQKINELETVSQESATIRPQHDYYFWPLSIALLLFCSWVVHTLGAFLRLKRFIKGRH